MKYAKIIDGVVDHVSYSKVSDDYIEVDDSVFGGMVEDDGSFYTPEVMMTDEEFNLSIYDKLDENRAAISYNRDRYGYQEEYAESYAAKEAELIAKQASLIAQIKEV